VSPNRLGEGGGVRSKVRVGVDSWREGGLGPGTLGCCGVLAFLLLEKGKKQISVRFGQGQSHYRSTSVCTRLDLTY
jgi:hypothetical protein